MLQKCTRQDEVNRSVCTRSNNSASIKRRIRAQGLDRVINCIERTEFTVGPQIALEVQT